MSKSTRKAFITIIVLIVPLTTAADPNFLGLSPYLGFFQSPFSDIDFDYFYLEDFEDQNDVNTPGVSSSISNQTGGCPNIFCDSVDEDDGLIDGSGTDGTSFFTPDGPAGVTFTFDEQVLGVFPTHVGIVWTDAESPRTTSVFLEGFDLSGSSLGIFGPHVVGESPTTGQTDEDRFLGVLETGGISAIRIWTQAGQMKIDHLQYGHLDDLIFADDFERE